MHEQRHKLFLIHIYRLLFEYVPYIKTLKGLQRGIVAMSLIRIGEDSKEALKELAMENNEYQWIADYLLSEI